MKIANGTGTCAEIPGHAALLLHSQMIVTALTETCDYNKAQPASCKQPRRKAKFIFGDAKKTASNFWTSNERGSASVAQVLKR
jgi:hypothetical protein